MKKVLLAVFLLCGFSLTAQAACPVFGPSEDPCSGPVFGPSTCECPWRARCSGPASGCIARSKLPSLILPSPRRPTFPARPSSRRTLPRNQRRWTTLIFNSCTI
ncbi:hypothetical protein FA140_20225 [Pseudomonas aeruginosa]|nr:hypothetical protein [Pseudomonas aeruginosa]